MGKASKKKARRRAGIGPSRAEFEAEAGQEQAERRLSAASRVAEVAAQAAAIWEPPDNTDTGLWGDATPVPAEVPDWEEGSLGDYLFTELAFAEAAKAPPAAQGVLPPVQKLLNDGSAREAVASMLIRAVALDGLPATDPAVGAILEHLAPVIEREAGHYGKELSDSKTEDTASSPLWIIGNALMEAGRAVIAEDRIAPVAAFMEPVLDSAVKPLRLPAELTGAAVTRAVICAVARAYLFSDQADTAFLDELDPVSATSENPLETLFTGGLVGPRDALLAGLAALGALTDICRTNAASALAEQ